MKHLFIILLFACCGLMANAKVLGILEDTSSPEFSSLCYGIHRLEIINNELYAASENGIYKYSEASNSWDCRALENIDVLDFKVYGENIVAIIVPDENNNQFSAIERATLVRYNLTSGDTENIMDSEMGLDYYGQRLSYLMRIAQHPLIHSTIMVAAYPGVWVSEDFGTTWNLKIDYLFTYNQNQFLGWHPDFSNVLFYTSETDSFNAQILRSSDSGENWDIINPDNTGENSCHHLAFDPKDSNHILYSGEGTIFESTDCGQSWQCVYRQDDNEESNIGYAYNVMFDIASPGTVYVVGSGINKTGVNSSIFITKSNDNGKTWHRIAKSEPFEEHEYWIHESTILKNKIYISTHKGVYAFDLSRQSGIDNVIIDIVPEANRKCNLQGMEIESPVSGSLYIMNGRKYIAD